MPPKNQDSSSTDRVRCHPTTDALYAKYHDEEWCVPVHDDNKLFEMITLEGAQAGLSWTTVLRKRPEYQKVFRNFDPAVVAKFNAKTKVNELMNNSGLIRNRLKLESTITNAKAFEQVQKEFGTFDKYIWGFVPGSKPMQPKFTQLSQLPAKIPEAETMSKALKKRGFRFCGPTICYAFMQAIGMTNDHLTNCFCYPKLAAPNEDLKNGSQKKAKKEIPVKNGKKK